MNPHQPLPHQLSTDKPFPNYKDLVGAKAGQAENALRERGYEWRNASEQGDSVYSNWTEKGTGNCVAIRTSDGRYQSIIYTPSADCDRQD